MIVTSIDAEFFPGLKALHNSIKRNSPQTKLACLTYGDDALAASVRALGVEVHHNLPIDSYLPGGRYTDPGCEPMYARLLAPLMYEKCIWLDADQIVTGDLLELFNLQFNSPVAAVVDPAGTSRGVSGVRIKTERALMSGLLVFNCPVWRELRITERCFDLMQKPGAEFRFVVQSVLNVVLEGNFKSLHPKWQGFANRKTMNPGDYKVLHWHGRIIKPWTHPDCLHADLWRQYQ